MPLRLVSVGKWSRSSPQTSSRHEVGLFLDIFIDLNQAPADMRPLGRVMAEIYALYSGGDGRVRYVGQTVGLCADRFKQHLRAPSTNLYKWFHKEWSDGYPVEMRPTSIVR